MIPEPTVNSKENPEPTISRKRPSMARTHGKNMRHLVKSVSDAFLNPRELVHFILTLK